MINSKLVELDISIKNTAHWQSNKYAWINSLLFINFSVNLISYKFIFKSFVLSNWIESWTGLISMNKLVQN